MSPLPKKPSLDEPLDRNLVKATQAGLLLDPQPYHRLAEQLHTTPKKVMQRLNSMSADGRIRRIGAVPNHYKIGYPANGMSVWDVPDERINELGEMIGDLDFVSHCYHRPRHPPIWRYNLFAMVHGKTQEEIAHKVQRIAALLGDQCDAHEVLVSTRILKKTGLRIN